jgi:glycyl-tRNA synthetase
MTKKSLQTIILELQNFWAAHGCTIAQPYYTQVGAGTMNPATFLRVLGPEPWSVAYVEPSIRPDDGRYGENPNRFQQHTQFQVILKPDPGDPQQLYLDSLKAIGIDPRQHDIRFVEDNWAQPAISAWGLGWEVWMDGQEITQFTYFQQVGGVALDPVSVEITYGLERILIALNNAGAIWDEPWSEAVNYGEIRHQEEYEHSKYYFEIADVDRLRQMYENFDAEANACLDAGLVLPAHDYVLKCSHTFNILDTRGAVGVTERQAFFRKMRTLARRVAETYLEQRQKLEYPLLKDEVKMQNADKPAFDSSLITHHSSFLLEIGIEEMPHSDVESILAQLRKRIPAWMQELRLEHGALRIHATPRRATVHIQNLDPKQPDLEELVKGPPASRAFDTDGNPTKAAIGFARGKGVDVAALEKREIDGGEYVVTVVKQAGKASGDVLLEALPKLMNEIRFVKTMKWNDSGVAFSRPIRWFVAMLGKIVIPFEYAGVTAGNTTRGLRPYDSPEFEIPSAETYFNVLENMEIVLDEEKRKAMVLEQIKAAAESAGGEVLIDENLLLEVTHLVEKPTAFLGKFPAEYLELPRDVLIKTMQKHQRYFAVLSPSGGEMSEGQRGGLLPYFIGVRNGDEEHLDIVTQGNEHVINARFADANFFVREDVKKKLEEFRPELSGLTFQTKLGSMLDKSDRMLKLGAELCPLFGFTDVTTVKPLGRAIYLSKADLVTQMVTEMTSLQGIIGREYALRSGEDAEVATAIGEQYQTVPQSEIGVGLALTDRIDSLVGLFAAGLAPTGTKDPFALRRAAIGVVQPLLEHNLDLDLVDAVNLSASMQPIEVDVETKAKILEFIEGRLRVVLREKGNAHDTVDAVLAEQAQNPARAAEAVEQLSAWVARDDWETILPAYSRCVRIMRSAKVSSDQLSVNSDQFVEDAERELYEALLNTEHGILNTVDNALSVVESLIPAINNFFDKVLVMAEDEAVKQNRLALVGKIASLTEGLADLSHLEGF